MSSPLNLDLAGRLVLVAGGGLLAEARVRALLAQGAVVRLVAPGICRGLAGLLGHEALQWHDRDVQPTDLSGAWLVHAATGRPEVDDRVVGWATERQVWCLAGHTAGTARDCAPGPEDSRVGARAAGAPSPDAAVPPSPTNTVRASTAGDGQPRQVDLRRNRPGHGRVILVGGGPGDPDLITLRGRRALAAADVVVADRLGPVQLLALLPQDVEVIDVGKAAGHHPVPQEQINRILVERALAGQVVVRLKGGDPYVLGRGGEEVLACRAAGVPVTVVPGVSSALAVPAAAGIPVTHRGLAAGFHVVTGHGGLGPSELQALRRGSATVVILMGVATLPQIAGSTLDSGVAPDTPVAVIERGTLPDQRVTRTTLAAVADDCRDVRPPAVIVIGQVAALDLTAPASSPAMVPA